MPFRHLLFNRRDGAPHRAPNQPPISLDAARYFSLETEFATYNRWPEVDYTNNPSAVAYNVAGMQSQLTKQLDTAQHSPLEQTNLMDVLPYQNYLHEFNSGSHSYSPEIMDTDTSSTSYSSLSSTSHPDPARDDDSESSYFTSRKASVVSSDCSEYSSTELCQATVIDQHRGSSSYGPTSLSLRHTKSRTEPVVNVYSNPRSKQSSTVNVRANQTSGIEIQPPVTQNHSQSQKFSVPLPCASSPDKAHFPSREGDRTRPRGRLPTSKNSTSSIKDDSKQVRKSRARQAHSQVERRYRENLNAKIQDLHRTLQTAQHRKPDTTQRIEEHEDDSDEEDQEPEKTSSKVKKSDVLVEAISYVQTTELEMRRKDEEIERLNEKVKLMENWIRNNNLA